MSSRAPDPPDLLARILDTPHLAQAVPRLQPEVLHRVIRHCGLESCSDLVALATPAQLSAVFDLDLWRSNRPGLEEQFDPARFLVWLEVLAESGADFAADKLAAIDPALVIAALAAYVRVFDPAAGITGADAGRDVGGYRIVPRRAELRDTIVEVLAALEASHHEYFHRAMQGCRRLSNSAPELDGLHDLMTDAEQAMFDLDVDRELRRERQGFVTPAQARAFLQMSRAPKSDGDHMAVNPIVSAYFRGIAADRAAAPSEPEGSGSEVAAVADVLDVLHAAGVLPQRPYGLLTGAVEDAPRLARMRTSLDFARLHDRAAYLQRSQELAFLANVIVAGSSIQSRAFTIAEAFDGAAAVCNLGLERHPAAQPDDFLVGHDLVRVFQHGWKVLHDEVCMFAATELIAILGRLSCDDREIQAGLDDLRQQLTRHCESGEPWRSSDALDVIAILDTPAWAALLRLIADFPVMHAVIGASAASRPRSVSASAYEFISETRQIDRIREFVASLPDMLSR